MKGFKQWTPEESALLIDKFNAGKKAAQIADELGRGIKAVQRKMRQLNLVNLEKKRPWVNNEEAQLILAINAGQTAAQISQATGRTITAIRNRVKLLRASGRPLHPTKTAILRYEEESDKNPESKKSPITPDDLAWMNKYSQQFFQRRQRMNNDARLRL